MINPASNDSTGKFILKVGNNTLYGLFDGVNKFYFDADYKPGRNTHNSYSRIGVLIQRINRGSFIHTTKYLGRYSRTIKIGTHQYVSLGLGLGVTSISLNGSMGVPGASASAIDGYAGLWYLYNKFNVGISLEQITAGVLLPMQQSFTLYPVLHVNMVYSFHLTSNVTLNNHLYFRKEKYNIGALEYAPVLLISDVLESGINFKLQRGVAVMLGVRTHLENYGKIYFMGSFLLGTRKLSTAADNKFEISARYFF